MESKPDPQIETALGVLLGEDTRIEQIQTLSGGCIHNVQQVRLDCGRHVVVKSGSGSDCEQLFQAEALGLQTLGDTMAIGVAKVLGVVSVKQSDWCCLVLEHIPVATPHEEFWEEFGRQLAELHRCIAPKFGFESDNFIGRTTQPNSWTESWAEFFGFCRIEPRSASRATPAARHRSL